MKNEKLIAFRKEQKLSVAMMAKKIGVSPSYYEKIEYGYRNSSYSFILKFKQAFPSLDVEHIFF